MVAIGEGFLGFGREGPEAGVGVVAEIVRFDLMFWDRTVFACEEFVIVVVAGGIGVLCRVGDVVGR